jgi:hypothetical protein
MKLILKMCNVMCYVVLIDFTMDVKKIDSKINGKNKQLLYLF